MDVAFDPGQWLDTKYAVGQPVSRKEDPKLLRGEGQYTDDLNQPGQAYATIVRSRYAHGVLRGVDAADEGWLFADELADHEEGGSRVVGGEDVEKLGRGVWVGAVVIGERPLVGVVAADERRAEEL